MGPTARRTVSAPVGPKRPRVLLGTHWNHGLSRLQIGRHSVPTDLHRARTGRQSTEDGLPGRWYTRVHSGTEAGHMYRGPGSLPRRGGRSASPGSPTTDQTHGVNDRAKLFGDERGRELIQGLLEEPRLPAPLFHGARRATPLGAAWTPDLGRCMRLTLRPHPPAAARPWFLRGP